VYASVCHAASLSDTLISQYKSHTNKTIQYLEHYVNDFHDHKDISKEYRNDRSTIRKVGEVTTRIRGVNSGVLLPETQGRIKIGVLQTLIHNMR